MATVGKETVPVWEYPVDFEDFQNIENLISARAAQWAESEKYKNQNIGEARAIQELAFRDAIVSAKSEKIGKKEKFFWVTVNPDPSKIAGNPDLFFTTIHKMYRKKWIDKYAYVFETTKGSHIHSHGLIKASYETARARKELATTVAKLCNISNVHCFKFVILTEEQAKEKMEYMLGKKQSSKLDDVEITIKWRLENDLQPIYTNEEPFSNLVGSSEQVVSANESEIVTTE